MLTGLLFSTFAAIQRPVSDKTSEKIDSLAENSQDIDEAIKPRNDVKLTAVEASQDFLTEIAERLASGEDPSSTVEAFVYWSPDERKPDFPSWASVVTSFTSIPVIHVSSSLQDAAELVDLNYVERVTSVKQGKYAQSASYATNPYVGTFPLLLNETREMIGASTMATSGTGVIIAILSTGINDAHPMVDDMDDDSNTIDPKIIAEFDADDDIYGGGFDTDDYIGRGTALASIVAGTACCGGQYQTSVPMTFPFPYDAAPLTYETQELQGYITLGSQMGIAPNASLMDIKITDNAGDYDESTAISGIEWAVDHGADIILLDAMNFAPSAFTILGAISMANLRGTLVVAPAGDHDPIGSYTDNGIAPYYTINSPASAPDALTVGAITETKAMWISSERGPVPGSELSKPDIVAPGVNMLAADVSFATHEVTPGEGWEGDDVADMLYYDIFSSTSIAAAVAAGASAHLLQSFPGSSPNAIKIALRRGATDLGFNEMAQGKGQLSLPQALTVLNNAAKIANNKATSNFEAEFAPSTITFDDFTGKRILFDGSYYSPATTGLVYHDWSEELNGDTTTGGYQAWQFPYADASTTYSWYNVTFLGASRLQFTLANLTLEDGDNFTLYSSAGFVPDPTGTELVATRTTNQSTPLAPVTGVAGHDTLYFVFGSDGDGLAAGSPVFGVYGTVGVGIYTVAEPTTPPGGTTFFEFDQLAGQLYAQGATVEYWSADSANAAPTATILDYYDVYVLPQPRAGAYWSPFGQANATSYYLTLNTVLNSYLDNGGNFLFIGDIEHVLYNNATEALGIDWIYGAVGGPTKNIVDHPLTNTPFQISELLIDAPYAHLSGGTTVVYDGNVPTVSYLAPDGKGKAVFVADEDVFNDDLWNPTTDPDSTTPHFYNNTQLAMNIFYWLTGVAYKSGPASDNVERLELIDYNCPYVMESGNPWLVNTTIQNTGNYTTSGIVAYGMDWSAGSDVNLGAGAAGNPVDGIFDADSDDNANDTWDIVVGGDGDINVPGGLNNTDIEFYYNISTSYPVSQVGLAYIDLHAIGMNSEKGSAQIYINDVLLGPVYETNATPLTEGRSYYNLYPSVTLLQYNNRIRIAIPSTFNLTLTSFAIYGYFFDDPRSTGVNHYLTGTLAPLDTEPLSLSFTPDVMVGASFQPEVLIVPRNLTHAFYETGAILLDATNIAVDYGQLVPAAYYEETDAEPYAVPKTPRQGPLPVLYSIAPATLDSSSSPKIVQFPGDIRLDGLTVMSSVPIKSGVLTVKGQLRDVVGFGNFSESLVGAIGNYPVSSIIAPNFFYLDAFWMTQKTLFLGDFGATYAGEPVIQTAIPINAPPGIYSGLIELYSGGVRVYSISLSITIQEPKASFLLYDDSAMDSITTDRNYDKLWDQLFEVWKIAAAAEYDVNSLYQEVYLYNYRNHVSLSTAQFVDLHIQNVPTEKELPYAGVIGAGVDVEDVDSPFSDFIQRGGSIIQFGVDSAGNPVYNRAIGPKFTSPADITYYARTNDIASVVYSSGSDNPLMDGVGSLFYVGGGYMVVKQDTLDQRETYDVVSGSNWFAGNLTRELAVVYHEAILPDQLSYDTGKYPQANTAQTNKGPKIIVGSDAITQSWFLEQINLWSYTVSKYAADHEFIQHAVDLQWGNKKFIENIFHVAGNKAPKFISSSVTPKDVAAGNEVTVEVNITDDNTPTQNITVLLPEKLKTGYYYVNMTYDNNTNSFKGKFIIASVGLINNWNIIAFDGLYKASWAYDGVQHFIPRMNQKPIAQMAFGSWFSGQIESQNLFTSNIKRGDLLSLNITYRDPEDGFGVKCEAEFLRFKNSQTLELIYYQVFTSSGWGLLFIDTSDLRDGTYLVRATVTDTDGGNGTYNLLAFNLGRGTMFKPPPEAPTLVETAVAVGGGAVIIGGIGAAGVGGYLFYTRRTGGGLNLGRIFRRGGGGSE